MTFFCEERPFATRFRVDADAASTASTLAIAAIGTNPWLESEPHEAPFGGGEWPPEVVALQRTFTKFTVP